MLDGIYVTKSISTGLYPNLDLLTANKLQLQLRISIILTTTTNNKRFKYHCLCTLSNIKEYISEVTATDRLMLLFPVTGRCACRLPESTLTIM